MLSDFSFIPPNQILKGLQDAPAMSMKPATKPMQGMEMKGDDAGGMNMLRMGGMSTIGMKAGTKKGPMVIAQKWDETTKRFVRTMTNGTPANIDVRPL